MADMSIYNSSEVRRAASVIKQSAGQLSGTAIPSLRSIRAELPENFKGAAADALNQRLYEVDGDITKLNAALTRVSSALYRFADEIDRADAQAKKMLRG